MSARGTGQAASPSTPGAGGGVGARIALVVLLVVLLVGQATLYGYGLLQAATGAGPDADGSAIAAAVLPQVIAGMLALGFTPSLGLLELRGARDATGPDGAPRRPVRLFVWLGVTALAVVVHAVASLLAGVSVLVVAGVVAAAVGTAATSWILVLRAQAAAVARRGAPRDDGPAISIDLDWSEGTPRRKWRLVALVFVIALVVTVAGTLLLDRFERQEPAEVLAFALQFSLLAPALTCIFVSIGAQLSGSTITQGLAKEDRTAVVRRAAGKRDELEPELEWRAARLAVYTRTLQPFQLGQSVMLVVAIFVPTLLRGDLTGWLVPVWIIAIACLAVAVPWGIVQHRRMGRYAAQTRHLARSHVPDPAGRAVGGRG
ncbi:hypothetical protein [Clavibacter sp. MX14-G9D]|uniref:hypothetical protein n=1 Tax=Clavibacter sp. MX14-G9D TaxID=3064656 RepID=UPI00293E76FF|nr:hypothetical protein [Clavibacter sp. MX14-G9D]